jgi:hypothetical protein
MMNDNVRLYLLLLHVRVALVDTGIVDGRVASRRTSTVEETGKWRLYILVHVGEFKTDVDVPDLVGNLTRDGINADRVFPRGGSEAHKRAHKDERNRDCEPD